MNQERDFFSRDTKVISDVIDSYTSEIRKKYGENIKQVLLFGSWAG
jgi:predicted nucleotidyltransferase